MLNRAIEKLKTEMDSNKDKSIERIGNFLLAKLSSNPEIAEKILNPDKSIIKSLNEMSRQLKEAIAKDQRKGEVVVGITDEEGFEIVLQYYGIEENKITSKVLEAPIKKSSSSFDVNIDDLL